MTLHTTLSVLVKKKTPAAAERQPPRRGRVAVPRPPDRATLGVPGERMGANSQLGERGASKRALSRTGRSLPGKESDARERRGFQYFRRCLLPGVAPTLASRSKTPGIFETRIPFFLAKMRNNYFLKRGVAFCMCTKYFEVYTVPVRNFLGEF